MERIVIDLCGDFPSEHIEIDLCDESDIEEQVVYSPITRGHSPRSPAYSPTSPMKEPLSIAEEEEGEGEEQEEKALEADPKPTSPRHEEDDAEVSWPPASGSKPNCPNSDLPIYWETESESSLEPEPTGSDLPIYWETESESPSEPDQTGSDLPIYWESESEGSQVCEEYDQRNVGTYGQDPDMERYVGENELAEKKKEKRKKRMEVDPLLCVSSVRERKRPKYFVPS